MTKVVESEIPSILLSFVCLGVGYEVLSVGCSFLDSTLKVYA